jgi:hypothetical protein
VIDFDGTHRRSGLLDGFAGCHARRMKQPTLPGVAAMFMVACCLTCGAQEKGIWRAASSTAESITGDIAISDAKLSINFTGFPIAHIRKLEPAETSAAFDADINAGGSGNLYRLSIPGSKRFLRHNTLCGTEDTQWMATYVEGRRLRIAFLSGSNMPVFTPDGLGNSPNLCGTFSYAR